MQLFLIKINSEPQLKIYLSISEANRSPIHSKFLTPCNYQSVEKSRIPGLNAFKVRRSFVDEMKDWQSVRLCFELLIRRNWIPGKGLAHYRRPRGLANPRAEIIGFFGRETGREKYKARSFASVSAHARLMPHLAHVHYEHWLINEAALPSSDRTMHARSKHCLLRSNE